jgi:hypothetical protein
MKHAILIKDLNELGIVINGINNWSYYYVKGYKIPEINMLYIIGIGLVSENKILEFDK